MATHRLIDTDVCDCCSGMAHERTLGAFGSDRAACDHLAAGHDHAQLLDGLFDEIVLQGPDGRRTPASVALRAAGYTADVLARMAAEKRRAALRWLNLEPPP